MPLLKTLTALFQAATAYLNRWHLWKLAQLENKILDIDDKIFDLALRGEPIDLLRIKQLTKDRQRLRALRSSLSNSHARD